MIILKIDGMSCMHCVKAVTQALGAVPGVVGVPEVDLASGRAQVEGSAALEDLIAALQAAGYPARAAD